jgi:AraC family transcriptional regulator of arabinose operon
MESGKVNLSYDKEHQELQGCYFWTTYPGPRIKFCSSDGSPWNHRYVAVRGPAVNRWISSGLLFKGAQICPQGKARYFAKRFDDLLKTAQRIDYLGLQLAANILENILLELADHLRREVHREPWLQKITDQLAINPNHSNYLELARDHGFGLSTLRRRFAKSMGVSIHQYTLQLRIMEARKLLGESTLPIKEIAERLGFEDVYYFGRQFKKQLGISPGKYRKSCQL